MNNKMKAAIGLVYIAFIGFAVDFFSYFGVYSVTSSYSSSSYSYSSSSKSILQACMDGTISGGRFCFILTLILLIAALIVDLAMAAKAVKGNAPSRGMFGLTIAFGVGCFILAIIQIAIFTKVGAITSESSSYGSTSSATISSGFDFLWLYVGSFEAAIFSIVGGGTGLKALDEPLEETHDEEPSTNSEDYDTRIISHSTTPVQATEPSEMNIGDIIKFRFLSGTSLYQKKNDTAIRSRIEGSDEFELLEKNEQSKTGKIRRLNDDAIFEDVGLSLFVIKPKTSSKVSKEKPTVPAEEKPSDYEETNKIKLLREYKQLLDDGIITQEEFENKKKDLLK